MTRADRITERTNMNEIAPCPFCGAVLRKYSDGGDYYHPNTKIEGGDGCLLNGLEFTPDQWAINRWNTRQPVREIDSAAEREVAKIIGEINAHSKMANDVIRAGRYDTGGGRVKIATCLHHIERLAALAQGKPAYSDEISPEQMSAIRTLAGGRNAQGKPE